MSLSKHVLIKLTVKEKSKWALPLSDATGSGFCRCFLLCNKWTHHHTDSSLWMFVIYVEVLSGPLLYGGLNLKEEKQMYKWTNK